MTAGDHCHVCGAAFTKPTAKFCSKCGTKKLVPHPPHVSSSTSSSSSTTPAQQPTPGSGSLPTNTPRPPITVVSNALESMDSSGTLGPQRRASSTVPYIDKALASLLTNRNANNSNSNNNSRAGGVSKASAKAQGKEESSDGNDVHLPPLAAQATESVEEEDTRKKKEDEEHNKKKEENKEKEVEEQLRSPQSSNDAITATLQATPEEEARYSAWATLGPENITPEMLQTANAAELRRWRRGGLIGRGTYGSVYLGLLPDGTFYAVKCVELGAHKTDSFNVQELVTLSREINMMQRLQHRNLCKFKGVYYDPESTSICMFMEYIAGGSLSALVKRFKPLPHNVVRSWTRQLLSGLLYLHSQHIIHRDVKGDNVLLDITAAPSTGAQVKLVDFGAARRLSDAVSRSRTIIGTPYWMAPEVMDLSGSHGGYSYKADVWSVGCTVAEMLTGRPPWPSCENAPAAMMMIARATDGPSELPVQEATPGCVAFMRRCFVRDPEERPTVEELLQDPWITGEVE